MTTLRLLVTAFLLVLVCYKAGVFSDSGRRTLYTTLTTADVVFLALSVLIQFALNLSSAVKWWMLLASRRIAIALGRVWAYYLIGQFYNLILPTSMGGDVVRMHELGQYTGKGLEAVASVFVERFTGLLMLVFLALVAVIFNLNLFGNPLITLSLIGFSGGVCFIVLLVLCERPYRMAADITRRRARPFSGMMEKIGQFNRAVRDYRSNGRALFIAFVNSAIFYALAVVNVWVSAKAFQTDVTLASALLVTPVILLLMNLPISIGGIGLMEFAYTYTFDLIGLGSTVGLSTALLMRAKMFMDAGIGAMLHPLIARGRSIPAEIRARQVRPDVRGKE